MTAPEGETTVKTFTQEEVNRVVADRLTRERAKFADYDELKAAAKTAEGDKSALQKMQEQLDKMEKRATAAEADAVRSSVAAELGLTAKQARRLSGATRDELLADGREMIEDLGIKTGGKEGDGAKGGTGEGAGAEGGDGGKTGEGTEGQTQERKAPRGRPAESLRSGAPMGESKTEEMDPIKLAAGVARRY